MTLTMNILITQNTRTRKILRLVKILRIRLRLRTIIIISNSVKKKRKTTNKTETTNKNEQKKHHIMMMRMMTMGWRR